MFRFEGDLSLTTTRTFDTGATRNVDTGKYDYEGFLTPTVIEAFAAYMHENRFLLDGSYRDSDNWQKGIPKPVYIKSLWRHFLDLWKIQRGHRVPEGELGASMGVLFNVMGWVFERIKEDNDWLARELATYREFRKAELEAREKAQNNLSDRKSPQPGGSDSRPDASQFRIRVL